MKLSIITINLNNSEGLYTTLTSVAMQTFADYELIVIDGGSDDGSVELIEMIINKRDIAAKLISEPDGGIFDAQNKGITQSVGEYLLFLNSGDYLSSPSILERVFSNRFSEDIVYGDIIFKSDDRNLFRVNTPQRLTQSFFLVDSLPHPCSFIKRDLLAGHGGYDEQYKTAADYDFFLRSILAGDATYKHISLPVSVFVKGGASSDESKGSEHIIERELIRRKYFTDSFMLCSKFTRPFILLFKKKIKYAFYFVKSKLIKSFMK